MYLVLKENIFGDIPTRRSFCLRLGYSEELSFSRSVVSNFFETTWTIAHQAPMSTGISRQEYWSGLTFPSPRDLPKPVIKPTSPALQADSLLAEPLGKTLQLSSVHFDSVAQSCPSLCDPVACSTPGQLKGKTITQVLIGHWSDFPGSQTPTLLLVLRIWSRHLTSFCLLTFVKDKTGLDSIIFKSPSECLEFSHLRFTDSRHRYLGVPVLIQVVR